MVKYLVDLAAWLTRCTDLIVNHNPWLAALIGLAVGWGICPAYMYALAVVSEWRWPKYDEQFKAFMPGNIFLGAVFSSTAFLTAADRRDGGTSTIYGEPRWSWISLGIAAVIVVAMCIQDVIGAFQYYPGAPDKYHWTQLIAWTKVWHNIVVYGAYGFLLIHIGVPGFMSASWTSPINVIMRIVLLAMLSRWITYLIVDVREPKHATGHVTVSPLQWLIGLIMVGGTIAGLAVAI